MKTRNPNSIEIFTAWLTGMALALAATLIFNNCSSANPTTSDFQPVSVAEIQTRTVKR